MVFHKHNCCVDSAMGCAALLSRYACIKGVAGELCTPSAPSVSLKEAGGIIACMQLGSGLRHFAEQNVAMHCNRGYGLADSKPWRPDGNHHLSNITSTLASQLATGYQRSHNADECKGLCGSLHMSSAAAIAFAACSISHPCLCYLGVVVCNAAPRAAAPRRRPSVPRVG